MRIIKNFRDLNVLVSSMMVEERLIKAASGVFWDNVKTKSKKCEVNIFSNFTKIIMFEKGDNLKNIDFLGFESKKGGVFAISPNKINHCEKKNLFIYNIGYNQEIIDIIITGDGLDRDVYDFLMTHLMLQKPIGKSLV
ncbi:hypothetical protein FZC78_09525 [Rossellomorea vietnamensis]|uniref:Uncharacterized protein n=1 Tax=Rossellomorea vietnamensis TaxID=218284 RepID=A0A5D4NUZ3_9BACI|nr:hypothetical protein [Rossellomorea vietnamensis]TYS18057.1 hypothetical protein FZC78_09525 [Rossellomorea vietnamensis]